MDESRTAHCICQSVEISISGEPVVMAYCHCDSCRSWLGAPIHAASLWPTKNVNVTKGEAHLSVYERTASSLRHFCRKCGSPVLIRHPVLGLTDVPAGSVNNLNFNPSIHVNYAERVMPVKDGLPKFAGMPDQKGNGQLVEE
jgi:hypothetical protein